VYKEMKILPRLRQDRLTFLDTLEAQDELRTYLNLKCDYPFVSKKEKTVMPKIVAQALLSQGVLSKIKPTMIIDGKTLLLGNDVHHFALRMVDLKVDKNGYTEVEGKLIDARELWIVLKDYCLMLFPKALAEGLHLSGEKERRMFTTSAYDWKAGDKVERTSKE